MFTFAFTGLKGADGAQGIQGPKGEDGAAGAKGDDGDDGYTPVKGTDYWTAADQAAIVSDATTALEAEITLATIAQIDALFEEA